MDDLFQCGMSLYNLEMGGVMENESTKVSVTLGYTLNLGNFQSLRLDLGIVESRKNGETIDQAFDPARVARPNACAARDRNS